MTVFLDTNHMVLRNPSGSDGNVRAMAEAGFGAVYCNVRDYPPEQWRTIRDRAQDVGVECGPWARTASGGSGAWDEAMLQRLVAIADDWNSSLIVNSEKELDGSGDTLTKHIATVLGDREYALSMEAWPFDSVDWTPLADVPVLPQIFPAEAEPAKDPDACRRRWHERGVRCVAFCFGSYAGMTPDLFDRLTPYGVYTADDCAGRYDDWGPLGTGVPCQSQPEPVPPDPPDPPDPGGPMPPVTDAQARESVSFAAQAWEQTQHDYTPKARLTVCRRICQQANTNEAWYAIRDQIVALLDGAGLPK